VLLIKRADGLSAATGSRSPAPRTSWTNTWSRPAAAREVAEETGSRLPMLVGTWPLLADWELENVYDIYPRWLPPLRAGGDHATPSICSACVVPAATAVHLEPARAH